MKLTKESLREIIREVIAEADDDKYTHIGYGKYKEKGKEKDKDAPTFKKDDGGKFVPFGKDSPGSKKPEAEPKITKIASNPFDTDDDGRSSDDDDEWTPDDDDVPTDPSFGPNPYDSDDDNALEKNKDKIQKMYDKGYAPEDIADELGISDKYLDDLVAMGDTSRKTSLDNRAATIQNITNDSTIYFDDYDDQGNAIYVSEDDPEMEYFVDKQGNITQNDGWKEKQIGNINKNKPDSPPLSQWSDDKKIPTDHDDGMKKAAEEIGMHILETGEDPEEIFDDIIFKAKQIDYIKDALQTPQEQQDPHEKLIVNLLKLGYKNNELSRNPSESELEDYMASKETDVYDMIANVVYDDSGNVSAFPPMVDSLKKEFKQYDIINKNLTRG
tara:strand:+ start:74 stop:1228 length:1155 start_codon:yes stop_codon:yes gene_type:complete